LNSFTHIAKKLGRKIIDHGFPSRYGGNIRVIIGNDNSNMDFVRLASHLDHESTFEKQLEDMKWTISQWKINTSIISLVLK